MLMIADTPLWRGPDGSQIVWLDTPDERWARYEAALDAAGRAAALPTRAAWARHLRPGQTWLLAHVDREDRCLGAVAVDVAVGLATGRHAVVATGAIYASTCHIAAFGAERSAAKSSAQSCPPARPTGYDREM